MPRRLAWLAAGGAAVAGGLALRKLRGGKERVELIYADGSTICLPDTHDDAQRLLPYGRDIFHLARD
jgi:hypothetical protein